MQQLPINNVLDDIKLKLSQHPCVVLQAPPGAGKTTAVPLALLNQHWLEKRKIIILEPRRLAARNAASRMAFMLNEKVGETVGYQIRQDHCFSAKTKILVVTEGILTRKLQADPELADIALVIFDEFHERSLHADLSLALCLQSQQVLREDLKILIMSATLNTQAIVKLLDDAPLIISEGKSYPVDIHYMDKPMKQGFNAYESNQLLISQLFETVKHVIENHTGSCLVFLPGVKEISQLENRLSVFIEQQKIQNILLAPLHGSLSKSQQDAAIAPVSNKERKIVLATNIAETSLTIEGINCVVDSGLERVMEYSPASAMNALNTRHISEDSAIQRSGRAGRLSAGAGYRLWTSQQQKRMQKHSQAEILHSDLSILALELANWGVDDVTELQWMNLPPASALSQARQLLHQFYAIDDTGKISDHGRIIISLGIHPRLAHMVVCAVEIKQVYHACLIASLLTERDIFLAAAKRGVDIEDRIAVLKNADSLKTQKYHVDVHQCKRIIQSADDIFKRLKRCYKNISKEDVKSDISGVLLAFAYTDRISKQRTPTQAKYLLSNGKGAFIAEHLQQNLHEYIVIANLDAKLSRGEARIYLCAHISKLQIEEYFEQMIVVDENLSWNDKSERVEINRQRSIGNLVLDKVRSSEGDSAKVQACLLEGLALVGLQCLNWTPKALSLKQRIVFINQQLVCERLQGKLTDVNLPDFTDVYLTENLSEWLQPYMSTENSIKHCHKLDIYSMLKSLLSWEQMQLIDRLAPESILVPSGSKIKIDYNDPLQPVLAVRLQEVFGLHQTPVILDGHCQLMMHLLSPAHRAMQVTQDLGSFWETTYHDVKKELRGQYKRHYWPDDPLTATATSKTKKNMHKPSVSK